jgi:hypothetical protein
MAPSVGLTGVNMSITWSGFLVLFLFAQTVAYISHDSELVENIKSLVRKKLLDKKFKSGF